MQNNIFKRIVDSTLFNGFVLFMILLAGVVVGLETYPNIQSKYSSSLHVLDQLILWTFAIEAMIKILSHGKSPWKYFSDGWNVFDFSIVVVCFLPLNAAYSAVLRLARILRVLRLVSALPKLQLLVGALIKSIPSMIYVFILLILHFYIFAVLGTFLFQINDPAHFGNLQTSMLTLFGLVTLEGWVDVMYINFYGCDQYGYGDSPIPCNNPQSQPIASALYFISFIITGAMIVLNLFIGVIMTGMEEAKEEAEIKEREDFLKDGKITPEEEIVIIQKKLEALNTDLKYFGIKLKAKEEERRKKH